MIYIVLNTKGGSGKSLISYQVLPILIENITDIVEIDNNNNTSVSYSNSTLFKNMQSIKLSKADDKLSDIFFDAISDDNKNIIVDAGGGDDTIKLLELLESQSLEKVKFIIPLVRGDDILNAEQTYKLIPKNSKVLFALNSYSDLAALTDEYTYFFGNEEFEIPSFAIDNKINEFLPVPFSNIFNFAKIKYKMTISDLAAQSMDIEKDEAIKMFIEKAKGNKQKYRKMHKQYQVSLKAKSLLETIKKNKESLTFFD